jgi:hypothetical protein
VDYTFTREVSMEYLAYYLKALKKKRSCPIDLFVLKMIVLGKVEAKDFHRVVGKFHGYPKCCIENYVHLIRLKIKPARYMYEQHNHRHKLGLVLCNHCHDIYQYYVGSNATADFGN